MTIIEQRITILYSYLLWSFHTPLKKFSKRSRTKRLSIFCLFLFSAKPIEHLISYFWNSATRYDNTIPNNTFMIIDGLIQLYAIWTWSIFYTIHKLYVNFTYKCYGFNCIFLIIFLFLFSTYIFWNQIPSLINR